MDLILDTHAFLWFFLNDPRMGEAQRQILRNEDNRLHLSAVSIFEMATKSRTKKLSRSADIGAMLGSIYDDYDLLEMGVAPTHALLAGRLDAAHRDPFDRLLAAQSLIERMPLMTCDPAFKSLGVETVW